MHFPHISAQISSAQDGSSKKSKVRIWYRYIALSSMYSIEMKFVFEVTFLILISFKAISSSSPSNNESFRIVSDQVVYSRWRKVLRRVVKFPNGNVVDYDVIDQKGQGAVTIFAWNSKTKRATLVKEYNPGCHRRLYGTAAGLIEEKHESRGNDFDIAKMAAQCELEEECHLKGGTWYRLTSEGSTVPMDKYVVTEITPYLVVDAQHVADPRPLDDEEDIEIITDVTIDEIFGLIQNGKMNLVGGWASMLAIEKLRELGEIR